MSALAKVVIETLLPQLDALENVGCSELIQIKGRLEAKAGDHRDSLKITIKSCTSPAIDTGWEWKKLGNVERHLQNRMQQPRISGFLSPEFALPCPPQAPALTARGCRICPDGHITCLTANRVPGDLWPHPPSPVCT